MSGGAKRTEVALRALAHPGRRQLLELVWDAERSSSELADRCGLSKPAASQHLKVLREADLVAVRVDGNRRLYRARIEQLAELRASLDRFWGGRLDALRAGSVSRWRPDGTAEVVTSGSTGSGGWP